MDTLQWFKKAFESILNNTADTRTDHTENIGSHMRCVLQNLINRKLFLSIPAHNKDLIIDPYIFDPGNINKTLVHVHGKDPCPFSLQDNGSSVPDHVIRITVGIAKACYRDRHILFSRKAPVIAKTFSCFKMIDLANEASPVKEFLQPQTVFLVD